MRLFTVRVGRAATDAIWGSARGGPTCPVPSARPQLCKLRCDRLAHCGPTLRPLHSWALVSYSGRLLRRGFSVERVRCRTMTACPFRVSPLCLRRPGASLDRACFTAGPGRLGETKAFGLRPLCMQTPLASLTLPTVSPRSLFLREIQCWWDVHEHLFSCSSVCA